MPESNEAIIRKFFDFCIRLHNFSQSNSLLKNCDFGIKVNAGKTTETFFSITRFIDYTAIPYIARSTTATAIDEFMVGDYSTLYVTKIDEDEKSYDNDYDDHDFEKANNDDLEMTNDELTGLIRVCSTLTPIITFSINGRLLMYDIDLTVLKKSNVNLMATRIDFVDCNICGCTNIRQPIISSPSLQQPIVCFSNCTFEKGWNSSYRTVNYRFEYDANTAHPVDFSMLSDMNVRRCAIYFNAKPSAQVLWSTLPSNDSDPIDINFRSTDRSVAVMINELISAMKKNNINVEINIARPVDGPINLVSLLALNTPLGILDLRPSQLTDAMEIFKKYFFTNYSSPLDSILDFQEELIEMGLSRYAK